MQNKFNARVSMSGVISTKPKYAELILRLIVSVSYCSSLSYLFPIWTPKILVVITFSTFIIKTCIKMNTLH
jgi:hypothetical protein